jgi:hypothetical protein
MAESDWFQHSGRSATVTDGDGGSDSDDRDSEDFIFFEVGAHTANTATRAAKKPKLASGRVAVQRHGGGGEGDVSQGGKKKGS